MALEDAFEDARKALQQGGGFVAVVLGSRVNAPTDWSWHPQVHWIVTENLRREEVSRAIPSNTRLMLFTDAISDEVYHPLHEERKRRRLPYMIRKTGDAIAEELKTCFPPRKAIVPDAPTNGNTSSSNGTAVVAEKKFTGKSKVKDFLDVHAQRNSSLSIAEEGRRLFRLAQTEGLETTIGSIQQAVRMWRRAQTLGSRPDSASKPHVRDNVAAMVALDAAIAAMTEIRAQVGRLDGECDALRKENEDLKMRIGVMRDAFKDIDL